MPAPLARALAAALLVCLALPAPAGAAEEPPRARVTQVDPTAYPEITLYVSVTGPAGTPVPGLSGEDFQITEDGRPVAITGFAGGGSGRVTAALVIDRSGSMEDAGKIDGARAAAAAFVANMRPGDRTTLIGFNEDAQVIRPFTEDVGDLREGIADLEPDGGTALYDALATGVRALEGAPGRRALILLSDGQDCRDDPRCPDEYGSRLTLRAALGQASAADQPVYVVGVGRRSGGGTEGVDEAVLGRIAEETGGEYFYAPEADQLAGLYARLAGDIQQEYRITYHSPRPHYDGTRRDIRVSVGGAPAAGAGYLQQHLINVRSNPVVGLILLAPIVWALVIPSVLRRASRRPRDATERSEGLRGWAAATDAPPATGATVAAAPSALAGPQPAIAHAGPASPPFCDQCGTRLRRGARFCSGCGAPVAAQVEGRDE